MGPLRGRRAFTQDSREWRRAGGRRGCGVRHARATDRAGSTLSVLRSLENDMFDSIRVGGGAKPGVLIVGHFQNEELDKKTRELDPFGDVAEARKRGEATGEPGRIVEAFPNGKARERGLGRTLLVGLGTKAKFQV